MVKKKTRKLWIAGNIMTSANKLFTLKGVAKLI